MFDPYKIKKDFPILTRQMNGKPLVYLDNAATTQKPESVIDAISNYYRKFNANIHRGVYSLAEEATELYETSRKKVAGFIGASTPSSVIFTRNTTESINLVAFAWARKFLKKGDAILLTELEHHANIVPWYLLSKERDVTLSTVSLKDKKTIDMDDFKRKLTPEVKLVTISAMSNVLGTIIPVNEIARLARLNNSKILLDGAQSVPHMPTNLKTIDCDFFAFSGHKMLGPTGVGVLWVRPDVLETMDPFLGGGEMISKVSLEEITWADLPLKFEAGTSNIADVVAFGESIDYLSRIGMADIRRHEKELVGYALEKLKTVSDLTIYGPQNPEEQGGAISFNHNVVHAHDVGTILSDQGVAIRVGHHCAQILMKALGVSSTARASFYIYNTKEDVDALIEALGKVNQVFGLTKSA